MGSEMCIRDRTDAEHGEVFTRRWVVDLILDMAGYTADLDPAPMTVVELSCGGGAFISAIVERLLTSAKAHGHGFEALADSLRAFDLSATTREQPQGGRRRTPFGWVQVTDLSASSADRQGLLGQHLSN